MRPLDRRNGRGWNFPGPSAFAAEAAALLERRLARQADVPGGLEGVPATAREGVAVVVDGGRSARSGRAAVGPASRSIIVKDSGGASAADEPGDGGREVGRAR